MTLILVSLLGSTVEIFAIRMAGRGDQRFNYLGLLNCIVWTWFTVLTDAWGLIPLYLVMVWTYIGNLKRWKNGKQQLA